MIPRQRSHSILVGASAACAIVACSALAVAQTRPNVECRQTETQAECHARLKCKADEELETCQKRLLKCRANEELEECQERVGSQPREDARQRDDEDRADRDREYDDADRERDERRHRDDADRERDERRYRDDTDRDRDRARRERRGRDDRARRRRGRGDGRGRDRGRHRGGGGDDGGFQANKTFGLGLELGEPTGLNGKYFFSDQAALDFGVGWIYGHYYYGDGVHLYADFLYHPVSLASAEAFELPLYIGVGLRYWDFDYCYMGFCDYDGSAIGIRIPVGVSFDFNEAPLDIFVQLVPVLDFVDGDYYDRYRDRNHFGIDFSVGIRYWFM